MQMRAFRIAAIAGALVAAGAVASAHTISSNFDCAQFGSDIAMPKLFGDPTTVEAKVLSVATKFAVVQGEDGRTILPAGTVIDKVQVADGWLGVWATLPEGTARGSLDRNLTYQAGEVLRHFFAEAEMLVGCRFQVRAAGGDDYVDLETFLADDSEKAASAGEDWFEPNGPGPSEDPDYEKWYAEIRAMAAGEKGAPGQAAVATSGMPTGALAGRVIFTYGGHGRTWDGDFGVSGGWRWQRGYTNSMMEDFGNADGSDAYAYYCFNAGATVVSFRPIGYQNSEVVIDNAAATFAGTWTNSSATRYWGSGTPYRFASTANTETATATYTPNIPSAGFYPVYTWVNYGSDRVPGQLYRINSSGGQAQVRVDHRRVGCGWVYLGTYYFNAGSNAATGSVVISNQNPPAVPAGSYVAIADAIRFGNGMGDVSNGAGISGYSRREESTVYWIQNGFGNGGTTSIWSNADTADDEQLSWSAPPRMAGQMYRVHSDTTAADKRYALYLGWHSNASGGSARGSVGLITGSPTTNQAWWADRVSDELDAASLEEDANWEFTWNDRASSTYTGGYGEITNSYFGSEMDATIIEVAYHDNATDAALLRDPKVRNVHGRAAYHAAVAYFNNFRGGTLAYLPEPPVRFRATNNGSFGASLSWAAGPTGGTKGQAATGYRVYRSTDGLGFDAGTAVVGTTHNVTGLTAGQTYYFRVTGTNAGGESFPTDTLAVRIGPAASASVLIVNAYDRIDKGNNVARPGLSPTVEQLILDRNNSYNYVRQHAAALAASNVSFDSCDNEALINNDINPNGYQTVVWIAGEESSADDTFNATERTKIAAFLNAGGKSLFVSGAEIGYELEGQAVDTSFYQSSLKADYVSDDGGSYQATGVASTIFAGITMNFPASATVYNADYPDVLGATGGSTVCANYSGGGAGGAAIQFTGGSPTRSVVNLGFPFECIDSSTTRNAVMGAVVSYFGVSDPVTTGQSDWYAY